MDNKIQLANNQQVAITPTTLPEWPSAVSRIVVRAEQLPAEVLSLGSQSISALNAGTGSRINGLEVFEVAIMHILEFYRAKWSSSEIEETADLMHQDYHYLHLAEIKHFVARAKKGIYNVKRSVSRKNKLTGELTTESYDGKIYGALTPGLLLMWISEYAEESNAARAFVYGEGSKPQTEQKQITPYVSPEDVAEALRVFEQMTQSARKQPKQEVPYQHEKMRQRCIKDVAEKMFKDPTDLTPDDVKFYNANRSEVDRRVEEITKIWDP